MSAKPKPIHTFSVGPASVEIFRGVTNDGHSYLYFELARTWRAVNGSKVNKSTRFYDRNEKEACKAIKDASAWIRNNPKAADEGWCRETTAVAT